MPFQRGIWGSPTLDTAYRFKVFADGNGDLVMVGPDGATPPNNASGYPPNTSGVAGSEYDIWDDVTPEMAGEITHIESDIQGTLTFKQAFTSIDIRKPNGTWVLDDPRLTTDWTATGTGALCFMNLARPTSKKMQLWTDPLNHSC